MDGGREPDATDTATGNLSASETGTPTDTTGDAGGSSAAGESSSDGSSTGEPLSDCLPELGESGWACLCDGEVSDPALCKCHDTSIGCVCPSDDANGDGIPDHPEPCVLPEPLCGLVLDATGTPQCMCDGALSDPSLCGCEGAGLPGCACEGVSCGVCEAVGALCLCGKFAAPPEFCASPMGCEPGLVEVAGGGDVLSQCQCDGEPVDPSLCGCVDDGDAWCECAGKQFDMLACAFPCAWDPNDPDDCFCGDLFAPAVYCL
jgi:hypothetical protein